MSARDIFFVQSPRKGESSSLSAGIADLAEQADAPNLKPGGVTRASSMLAIGIEV